VVPGLKEVPSASIQAGNCRPKGRRYTGLKERHGDDAGQLEQGKGAV
jgi:hypothetical protein